jgi:hypothetical protein
MTTPHPTPPLPNPLNPLPSYNPFNYSVTMSPTLVKLVIKGNNTTPTNPFFFKCVKCHSRSRDRA